MRALAVCTITTLGVTVGVTLGARAAHADVETTLEVHIDTARRLIAGRERVVVTNPTGAPLATATFWLYPNRLADQPRAIDDVDRYWVYPLGFSPAFMTVVAVKAGGRDVVPRVRDHPRAGKRTLLDVALPEPVPPGGRVVVEVSFQALVPERYGGFGCTEGGCTLLGGFYPMLAELGAGGWDLEAPPAPGRIAAEVTLDRELDAVAGGEVRHGASFNVACDAATHLPLVLAPALFESTRVVHGVTVRYLSPSRPPATDEAERQIIPYTEENYANMVLNGAAAAIDLLQGTGAEPPAGTTLVLVAAPLRLELASAQPGMVVVSDRLFHILPAQATRKFHERELVRAIYTELLGRGRVGLPARERDLAIEAGAAYLLDVYQLAVDKGARTARELLGPVSFVPEIDNLIEAQQVAFADAYFGAIADPDRFRDDMTKFASARPRGSLLYQKLRDLLTPAELRGTMRRVILEPVTLAAAAPIDRDLSRFFAGWSGSYPAVDYRLGRRTHERLPDGRTRHHIEIEKLLPPGADWPVEPVHVRVVDGEDRVHDLVWSGDGGRGEVTLETAGDSLASVEIDPGRRLVQTDLDGENDPRFNDRTPPRWKLLYSGIGVVVNVSDFSVGLLLNLLVKRLSDIRHLASIQIFANQATTIGAQLGYFHRFGEMVTPARLAGSAGVTLTGSRLSSTFGLAPSAGWRGSLGLSLGYDSRATFAEPTGATIAAIGARYTLTRFDVGGDALNTASISASLGRLFALTDEHTFVVSLDAAAVAGDLKYRPQLLGAGGSAGLPGYGIAELFGRATVLGHLEWRAVFRHDLDWNFGHLVRVRSIGMSGMFDAGLVSGCSGYSDLVTEDNLFASVGFGLRILYDNLGVQPNVMTVEVAAPIAIRPRQCLGASNLDTSGGRPPVMVYLSFFPG